MSATSTAKAADAPAEPSVQRTVRLCLEPQVSVPLHMGICTSTMGMPSGVHPDRVGGGEEAVDIEDPRAHVHLEVPAPEVGRDLDGE
jgi:hypothetical protein